MTTWCRFEKDNVTSYGVVEDGQVIAVDGTPFGDHKRTARAYPLASVKLLIPVVPPTFYCVGINYADHIRKMAAKRKTEPVFPKRPDIGYRANNALIAHEENIVKPADSGEAFQYEGELVAVFGKRCRNVRKEDALDYVLGWTIGNDVSERGWQSERPHALARQECRYLQADGAVDRHRARSGLNGDGYPLERQGN